MVALSAARPDYEFVIWLSGWHESGFPEFIPWSALKPASQATRSQPQPLHSPKETIMKTSTLIAAFALSFAAAGAALAQEATYELPQPLTSTTSRAQVQAELQKARADGSLRVTEGDFQKSAPFVAQRSRSDVKAETLAAITSGEVAARNGEHGSYDAKAQRAGADGVRMARTTR
jgi:Domain of unknown function (DUF4148)